MIPQRIRLKGFLCYKDEQEVSFDGASLWMLAGINGSGKSTVFDAVTYALFGHHRGGKADAHELINKDSDRLAVEFEFTLDGQPYLVKRTLQLDPRRSAKGTQQLFHRQSANGNGQGTWAAVEGTGKKTEFDAWVRDNIGLDYDTFTSSVLLEQGRAEKLLSGKPKERFEVLAGIVDLERYEKLHAKADGKRKELLDRVGGLRGRLTGLPEVTAEKLAGADQCIGAAETARQQAEAEVDRLRDLEVQARQWGDLQARLAGARQRWQQAQQLLADAADIARAVNRLEELCDVLPRVQTVVEQRAHVHKSEARTQELVKEKQRLEVALADRGHAVEQARRQRATLEARIAADEQKHRAVAADLRQATGLLTKLKEYEQHQSEQGRLRAELARLPADPEAAFRSAQEEYERLTALAPAVTLLSRLHAQRDQLGQARAKAQSAEQSRQQVHQRGQQLKQRAEGLHPQVEAAAQAARQATEEATRLRTLLEQAQQQLDEITSLQGAKLCRHCGQELTEGHLREEQVRRQKELTRARADYQRAAAEQQAAQKNEQQLREQFARLEQELQSAREEYAEQRRQSEQAQADIERLNRECVQAHAELAEPFHTRVSPAPPADWLQTTFPTAEDLADLRRQTGGLAAARQRQQDTAAIVQRWGGLRAQESTIAASLDRLRAELPGDPQAVRQQHIRLEAEEQTLDQGLKALRAEAAETQKQIDRLSQERQQVQQQAVEVNGKLSTEEATRQHCQQTLNRNLGELPPAWQSEAERAGTKELYGWQGEQKTLENTGTVERGRQLAGARAGAEHLRRELAELEQKEGQFGPEARQDPVLVQTTLQQAKQVQREREHELMQARQQKAQLESYQQQRQQLDEELLQADKELSQAKTLAELLGRDRLQLYLVRQAERQVVDHANAVLDRLSGGQLYLRLCGEAGGEGSSAKALELEAYNRTTGEKPINVAFLSGSQKFRVAVSLALGIGQYASRQHRPIESVIIDEGFGCLDKEGRQAMIQELQNLRGHLRCILLVSHQEEFADAFADGYRFELDNGATRVTRFQR